MFSIEFSQLSPAIEPKTLASSLTPSNISDHLQFDKLFYKTSTNPNILLYEDVAIQSYGCEDVDAVHPQQSQQEARHPAEILPEFPAKLSGGGEVHRNTEHGHDQLAEGDVHQEEVELRLQLKHKTYHFFSAEIWVTVQCSTVIFIILTLVVHYSIIQGVMSVSADQHFPHRKVTNLFLTTYIKLII